MRIHSQRFDLRQTMKKSTFEVFHYRDRSTQQVAMHYHDFYEVYFYLGSPVEYRVEGQVYTLHKGDLLLIGPQALHQPLVSEETDNYERIVLWINREWLEQFTSEDLSLLHCFEHESRTNLLRPTESQFSALMARLHDLLWESYSTNPGSDLCAQGVFLQFMVELNRLSLMQKQSSARIQLRGTERSELISNVLAYIGAHFHEPLSLDLLSERFFVSKYHLSHTFREEVGTSIYRYIMLKRLLLAKQLLLEGEKPNDVCRRCGFNDYANFYRAFSAEYGVSPKDYRSR